MKLICSSVNGLCLHPFLTAEWHDNENKVVCVTTEKVSCLDPHTGTHSSTQVGRVNQRISRSLWDWISVWRLGSDGTQISYFHRQAHFGFCRLGWALTSPCLLSDVWPRWHCQCCSPELIFTIMLSLIHLIFKKLEVSRSQAKKLGFLTVGTCPVPITDSFYQRNTTFVWACKGMNKEIGNLIHSFVHRRQDAC